MAFEIILGYPDIEGVLKDLEDRLQNKTYTRADVRFYKKLNKCLQLLALNPRHPGLHSHKIDSLKNTRESAELFHKIKGNV